MHATQRIWRNDGAINLMWKMLQSKQFPIDWTSAVRRGRCHQKIKGEQLCCCLCVLWGDTLKCLICIQIKCLCLKEEGWQSWLLLEDNTETPGCTLVRDSIYSLPSIIQTPRSAPEDTCTIITIHQAQYKIIWLWQTITSTLISRWWNIMGLRSIIALL